ncbi:hypothetical protein LDP08_24640, partial [Ralstonia pseudosolanacearum]|uniref:hypothetical protein n=1 Tax=Ralstonia pseudosolanacearum TaxID=1310165 RepID=UPI003CED47C4
YEARILSENSFTKWRLLLNMRYLCGNVAEISRNPIQFSTKLTKPDSPGKFLASGGLHPGLPLSQTSHCPFDSLCGARPQQAKPDTIAAARRRRGAIRHGPFLNSDTMLSPPSQNGI